MSLHALLGPPPQFGPLFASQLNHDLVFELSGASHGLRSLGVFQGPKAASACAVAGSARRDRRMDQGIGWESGVHGLPWPSVCTASVFGAKTRQDMCNVIAGTCAIHPQGIRMRAWCRATLVRPEPCASIGILRSRFSGFSPNAANISNEERLATIPHMRLGGGTRGDGLNHYLISCSHRLLCSIPWEKPT